MQHVSLFKKGEILNYSFIEIKLEYKKQSEEMVNDFK